MYFRVSLLDCRSQRDPGLKCAKHLTHQNTTDQSDLKGRRYDVKYHASQKKADALGSTVNRSCEAAGLPREMEVEVEM